MRYGNLNRANLARLWNKIRFHLLGQSQLEQLIPGEIAGDAFYHDILEMASREPCRHVLEIGSSSGGGSTSAFVKGIEKNPTRPNLYCMEVSKERWQQLQSAYQNYQFVKCYNYSSVRPERFATEVEVIDFYNTTRTNLNKYPIAEVIRWLKQDLSYLRASPATSTDGIRKIKAEWQIDVFDIVLIDGSAFTGKAELDDVYGSTVVMLDDINDIKNNANYKRLRADSTYKLLVENWTLRNGYAIFRREKDAQGGLTKQSAMA